MKNKTYLKVALASAILLLGVMGGLIKADETLEVKITRYLGVAEQTILPDSSFYLSKNISRLLDRLTAPFSAADRVNIDLEKLSELTRELADIHFNSTNKTLESKVYDLYADWSDYLTIDYTKASASGTNLDSKLESSIATESLKQLVVINELEKDGLDPLVAGIFRKAIIQNWTLSLDKLGSSQWSTITLGAATNLERTITNKDMLDALDAVELTLDKTTLSNLIKGVIINLAGLSA